MKRWLVTRCVLCSTPVSSHGAITCSKVCASRLREQRRQQRAVTTAAGTVTERTMDRLKRAQDGPTSCWVWPGPLQHGYGRVYVIEPQSDQHAHRWVWTLYRGPLPDELVIDHLCRNRACVNPDHLEPVTSKVNILRGVGYSAIAARKTHCKHGHEFTEANTYYPPSGPRRRQCRTCLLERRRAARAAAKTTALKAVGVTALVYEAEVSDE